jgi:hypothetical protein
MKNPLSELTQVLTSQPAKKERKIMKVISVLSGGFVLCELNGEQVILQGDYSLNDNVIVIDSQIVSLSHQITNEYEV